MSCNSLKLYKEANNKDKWWTTKSTKRNTIKLYLDAARIACDEKNVSNEIKSYKKAAKILRKIKDKQNLANCYLLIGHLKWSLLMEYTCALKYYTKSSNIYTEIGSTEHIAYINKTIASMYESKAMKYNNVLSQIYYKNVDIGKAIYMYQQASIYYKDLHDTNEYDDCQAKIKTLTNFLDRYKTKRSNHSDTESPIHSSSSYLTTQSNSSPSQSLTTTPISTPMSTPIYCSDDSNSNISEMIASQFLV